MKKAIFIILSSITALALFVIAYSRANGQTTCFEDPKDGHAIATYPFADNCITIGDSLIFRIDTGAPVSTITRADLKRISRMGIEVDSGWFPSVALDLHDDWFVASRRYKISLPVYETDLKSENVTRTTPPNFERRVINHLKDITFIPAEPNQPSTIGMDVLERFVIEQQSVTGILIFRLTPPDSYQHLAYFTSSISLGSMIGLGRRYYLNMSVENNPADFFIDTSLNSTHARLPLSDTVLARTPLVSSRLDWSRGSFPAVYSDGAMISIVNRAGLHSVYYSNSVIEKYAINPFSYFSQDVLLDFPNREILIRPTAKINGIPALAKAE